MRGGSDRAALTYAQVDGLEPHEPRERDGRPSFWERSSRALPHRDISRRENNASRPSPVGGVNELVKYADVVPGALPAVEKIPDASRSTG